MVALCSAVLCVFTPAGAPAQAHSQTGASGMPPLVAHDSATGSVRFMGSLPGSPIARPTGFSAAASPAAVARAFLARSAGAFGIGAGARDLTLSAVRKASAGRSSVRFQQTHDAVPVLGGELVVNLDRSGNILSTASETLPATDLSVVPRVNPAVARRTAIAATARVRGVAASALRASAPRLWIYDSALLGGPGSGRPTLVWRTDVTGRGSSLVDELVLVDAQRGAVVLRISQIEQAKYRRVCDAHNRRSEEPCTARVPLRVEGGPPSPIRDVNDAYTLTGATYDFYMQMFGRDSLDNAGMALVSTTRSCVTDRRVKCPMPNAYWDPAVEQVFFGRGYASADDVVGHELTHAVVDYSSNLLYYFESGAIDESIADTLGELFDQANGSGTDTSATRWLIGEDTPDGAFRDMKHPTRFEQPDRMTSDDYALDADDYGEVHTNSGVGNKAAYLITDGGTFHGTTVRGLGATKAAKIYYELATNQLTSASDYGDLFYALPQACRNLVGTAGISEADCEQVVAAVSAVKMSFEHQREAAVCPGGGTAHDLFYDDLENPASGNWTLQQPGAADVWHYPQSPDRTYARSGHTNFWGDVWSGPGAFSIAMTRSVHIPESEAVYLHFAHAYAFISGFEDQRRTGNLTGGVVEYRTEEGEWIDAGALWDEYGGYGSISHYGRGFVGTSNGYGSSRANLGSLAGHDVRFRFTIDVYWTDFVATNARPKVSDGWFIDDVRIYTCSIHPPTTTIRGPKSVVAGRSATWTFSATDAAPDDQAGVILYTIDWNGDGRADASVTGGSSVSLPHPYTHSGRQTITATAADHHGSEGNPKSRTIVVRAPVQIVSSSLVLGRDGFVLVRLRSLAAGSRVVTVTLRSASRLGAAGKKRYVLLGRVRRTIGPGETASVRVRLSPQARALVERLGTVRVKVTAAAGDRATRTLILRER